MGNTTQRFRETPPVPQLIQESQIKSKTAISWGSHKKKKEGIFYTLENVFNICVLSQCILY